MAQSRYLAVFGSYGAAVDMISVQRLIEKARLVSHRSMADTHRYVSNVARWLARRPV